MCLRESLEFPKEVKPLVVDDVKCRIAREPVHGKGTTSQINLGYTELFCVPEVTSVFFSSCDSVLGDSLEVHQANRGSLRVWLGTRNCSTGNAWDSGLASQ